MQHDPFIYPDSTDSIEQDYDEDDPIHTLRSTKSNDFNKTIFNRPSSKQKKKSIMCSSVTNGKDTSK
jgi:hypothetical protein